ncbi:MAG: tryptophanyl-tRNA synthetase, tryptophanyl-tRNA synthetase [Candidatus Paceibacter sp.]|jgi:tryptophanyl-tRNA synthetase|nr:tryptophanyl-tRNA synthetase, tryptophanyl-tRNA synthetase [Candidatus Paceibacter sp.]
MNTSAKKILLSGVKPTGRPHIGNYFGAMKQFVDLQDEYNSFIFIPDYHALNSIQDAKVLSENILGVVIDYLTIGLDPKKVTFYKQSDIPEHTELCWIFNTLATMPYLMRAHAFKDAEAKNKEINVGTFDYPMLMAADILLYDADVVPVGQDQKQHVEITRDMADKFNRTYGEVFKMPKEMILENVKVVPGTDGQKMSKSYNNTIPLFATDEEIKKAVMSIPTDSRGIAEPKDIENDKVFALHKLFQGPEFADVEHKYTTGGMGYKESKEILIKNISEFIAPLREKREKIAADKAYVLDVLQEGGKKAKKIAEAKMELVREKIGVSLY